MKPTKTQKFIDQFKAIQELSHDKQIPYEVWTVLFESKPTMQIVGNQVCIANGDYVSLETARGAIEWLVSEFGGTVKWSK